MTRCVRSYPFHPKEWTDSVFSVEDRAGELMIPQTQQGERGDVVMGQNEEGNIAGMDVDTASQKVGLKRGDCAERWGKSRDVPSVRAASVRSCGHKDDFLRFTDLVEEPPGSDAIPPCIRGEFL